MKLTGILAVPRGPNPSAALPVPAGFNHVCDLIERRWPVPPLPQIPDEAVLTDMRRRLSGRDFSGLRMSIVLAAARAAFAPKWLADSRFEPVRGFLVRELAVSTRPSLLVVLATVAIETYEPGAPHTMALTEKFREAAPRLPERWRLLYETLPELLDGEEGHLWIAERMAGAARPYDALVQFGLPDPHGPGICDHAHLAFLDRLGPRLARGEEAAIEQVLAWLGPTPGKRREKDAASAIVALLAPWRERTPAEPIRERLRTGLVDLYGDPRVKGGVWTVVPGEIVAVLRRWLTGSTLKAFLDIVSEVEESHMWAPRREFWWGLYTEGRIDEAWVALSSAGANVAASRRLGEFARQVHGGGANQKSLLIMRIGHRIVVEGSHNYQVHVFPRHSPNAPPLYAKSYDCEEIRRSLPDACKHRHVRGWEAWVRLALQ